MPRASLSEKTIKSETKNPPEPRVTSAGKTKTSERLIFDSHRDAPRGFGLRVTSAGSASFFLDYRIDGRQRRLTIGAHPDWSLVAAREEARELRRNVDRGDDPLTERRERLNAPTVEDLASQYLQVAKTKKRPSSLEEDQTQIRLYVTPLLGRRQVQHVAKGDVRKIHASLQDKPYRANRLLALLSTMWNLAIEEGWATTNPTRGIERYDEQPRERWLSSEEIARLLKVLEGEPGSPSNIVKWLLLTGCRAGEARQARWADIDVERGVWTKPSHHTKQKKTEHLPLSAAALGFLSKLKEKSDETELLFPSATGTAIDRHNLGHAWRRLRKKAELEGVRLHDLRHSFASHLVSSGQSLHIVGKLLGHTQASTTQRYAHVADQALREAANLMGSVVESAGNEKAPVVEFKR